jgi:DNA-binding PadR family transcriptional regulator
MARHKKPGNAKVRRQGALDRLRVRIAGAEKKRGESYYDDDWFDKLKQEIETLEHRIANPNWKRDKKRQEATAEWLDDMAAANAA